MHTQVDTFYKLDLHTKCLSDLTFRSASATETIGGSFNQLCLASSIRSSSWLLIPHYQSLICGTTGERLNERTLNFIVVSK